MCAIQSYKRGQGVFKEDIVETRIGSGAVGLKSESVENLFLSLLTVFSSYDAV